MFKSILKRRNIISQDAVQYIYIKAFESAGPKAHKRLEVQRAN